MKHFKFMLTGMSALSLLALSSCMDDAYDLSDIDTTARLQVKELTIPLNLDHITLEQIINLDESSEIVKETDANGNLIYAIKKEGTFKSDPINVAQFTTSKPSINPSITTLYISEDFRLLPDYVPGGITAYYPITSDRTEFSTQANNIDKSIKDISKVGVETQISTKIKIKGLSSSLMSHIKFEKVKMKFPKGLDATPSMGAYDPATGILDLSNETIVPDANGEIAIFMNVEAIDATVGNVVADYENHTFNYQDYVQVTEGQVSIYADEELPSEITFSQTPNVEPIKVKSFTGEVEYHVDEFNIDPVKLNDIPDFLNQPGTEIRIDNPQIYLTVSNPMAEYHAYFQTGFELTSKRNGKSKTYTLDEGIFKTQQTTADKHTFVLSPKNPSSDFEGYTNPQWVKFSTLGNILADVDGIPTTIEINAIDPQMPKQAVTDFRLGRKLDAVSGSYAFYAPFRFKDGSQIIYSDVIDDWNDEELDKMTISKLVINFDGSTQVPFDMDLTIKPIDTTGKAIEGVTSTPAKVQSKANNQPIEIVIEGNITNLDGISIDAKVVNVGDDTTLGPEMKLFINNLKAKVTGYYEDEF